MKRAIIVALAFAAVGCFNEPKPASATVPEGARLYLQDRALRDLSSCRELLKPELVDYVNLDRNELEVFPQELATLRGLKWLRLNRNKLTQMGDVSPLVSLRRIYLRGNRFSAVPEELKALPSLTDIDLSQNPITEIPDWLVAKKGLENVSLTDTLLKKLPDDLSGWQTLTSLQLGGLRLSPDEMARIRKALPKVTIVF